MELNKLLLIDIIEKQNYCTICGCELSVKSMGKISHCDKINCKNNYYMIVSDNRVIELYNRDSKTFLFLINILLSGLSHPKASLTFNPLPFIPDVLNIEQLIQIIPKELHLHLDNNYLELIEKISSSINDFELINKLNPLSYCIIKNAISNNYFSMNSGENSLTKSNTKSITIADMNTQLNTTSNDSLFFININYSAQIENIFYFMEVLFIVGIQLLKMV